MRLEGSHVLQCAGPLARFCRALLAVDVLPEPGELTIVPHDAFVVSLQFVRGDDPFARATGRGSLPFGCTLRETVHTYTPLGNCRSFFALLTPEGAVAFAGGASLRHATGPRVALMEWLPRALLVALEDRMAHETDPRVQLQHLAHWIETQIASRRVLPWPAQRAARMATGLLANPRLGLQQMAALERVGVRQAERDFRHWLGTTARQVSLIGRVQGAARQAPSAASLAQLAASVGFVDQSHMNRVVKQLTGSTPSVFKLPLTPLGTAFQRATRGGLVYR